ncbi:MAG: class I SAM-dependent methyltransferase [Elusimicrobia bacterium]|nr:class I SAM-dependent methyltransferase [Elusimicrobiota bacterium]
MHLHYDERACPDNKDSANFKRHLARYQFAIPWVRGRRVLDMGCGMGYGADCMSGTAQAVTGIDISVEAIEYARRRYQKEGLRFLPMDCEALEFRDETFGAVCAFEVIEHLKGPEKMLSEIIRVLAKDGIAILSTPNKSVSSEHGRPANPYHFREFNWDELQSILSAHFESVEVLGQSGSRKAQEAMHGTPGKRWLARMDPLRLRRWIPANLHRVASRWARFTVEEDLAPSDFPIESASVRQADYFVAVCRKGGRLRDLVVSIR